MNYSQMLKNESETENSKVTEFLQTEYKKFESIIAIEGPDDEVFYYDYFADYKNKLFFKCNGKKGVLNLSEGIKKYSTEIYNKITFLCDKDYDDYLEKMIDGIKYTNHYSIESYLCLDQFATYILNKYSRLQISQEEEDKFISDVNENLSKATSNLKEICALMIETRHRKIDANFDNTSINDFLDSNFNKLEIDRDFLERKWEIKGLKDIDNHMRWSSNLDENDFKSWVRGKYMLQLMKKIFEKSYKKIFIKKNCDILNFYGKDGFNIIKLCLPKLDYINH